MICSKKIHGLERRLEKSKAANNWGYMVFPRQKAFRCRKHLPDFWYVVEMPDWNSCLPQNGDVSTGGNKENKAKDSNYFGASRFCAKAG
jgi:hypothetical protein